MPTIVETLEQEIRTGSSELGRVIMEGGQQLADVLDAPKSTSDEIKAISNSFVRDITYTADKLSNRINELTDKAIEEKEQNAEDIAEMVKFSMGKIMEDVTATIVNIKEVVRNALADFVENRV